MPRVRSRATFVRSLPPPCRLSGYLPTLLRGQGRVMTSFIFIRVPHFILIRGWLRASRSHLPSVAPAAPTDSSNPSAFCASKLPFFFVTHIASLPPQRLSLCLARPQNGTSSSSSRLSSPSISINVPAAIRLATRSSYTFAICSMDMFPVMTVGFPCRLFRNSCITSN